MWDELSKAQRYRGRAEERRRLAQIGCSADIRDHHLRMAEYYSAFAEAEEAKYWGALVIAYATVLGSAASRQLSCNYAAFDSIFSNLRPSAQH